MAGATASIALTLLLLLLEGALLLLLLLLLLLQGTVSLIMHYEQRSDAILRSLLGRYTRGVWGQGEPGVSSGRCRYITVGMA